MTTEDQRAIADRVKAAFKEVQAAIEDAADAGLEVEYSAVETQMVSRRIPTPVFNVRVLAPVA